MSILPRAPTAASLARSKTPPVVCFRDQQPLKQPVHAREEETVQLLPVMMGAAAGGQRYRLSEESLLQLDAGDRWRVPQSLKKDRNGKNNGLFLILNAGLNRIFLVATLISCFFEFLITFLILLHKQER